MNREKLFVIDCYSFKDEHSLVARSFIPFFEINYDVKFMLNQSHSNIIRDKTKLFKFIFSDSFFAGKYLRLLNREIFKLIQCLLFMLLYRFSGRNFVFLGCSNFQVCAITFFSIITLSRPRFMIHSQMEAIGKKKEARTFFNKMFITSYKLIKKKSFPCLFLSKHIALNILDFKSNYFITHPIPYCYDANNLKSVPYKDDCVNIGTIGLLSKSKKSSDEINKLCGIKKIKVHIIGRLQDYFYLDDRINKKLWTNVYPQHEFDEHLSKIDILVYFFNNEQYKYTASGTVIDAIYYGKFIFYIKNPAIDSLLENYPYSQAFDSVMEMRKALKKISIPFPSVSTSELRTFQDNYLLTAENNPDASIVHSWISHSGY